MQLYQIYRSRRKAGAILNWNIAQIMYNNSQAAIYLLIRIRNEILKREM
jgi:hypothetical protein